MDGIGGNAVQKRRFPSWMLGVAAGPDNEKKPGKGAVNTDLDDAPPVPKVRKTASRSRDTDTGKVMVSNENEQDKVTSSSTSKCETKGKRRRGKEVKVAATPRKRTMRKCSRLQSIEESDEISESEDDGDLTMDDMMNIANEYVTANKEQRSLLNRDRKQESQLQPNPAFKNVLRGSSGDPQTNKRLQAANETTASTHHSSGDKVSSKGVASSITTTGDTAQDMLNLFLGPLLSQPSEKETKQNFMTEDVHFISQYGKHSQNGNDREEVVTVMKKRSSLKDKIAMFLD